MQTTDNFSLIVVEGSDTVNLLTQMNPNTEKIDEQMFKNQNAGVQTATELLSGTVHAITRSVPDASMIRFTAVSRFTAGDTFTVDGVQVSALLPSGEQLPDGAFIIGSEVLCILKGTLLTVFASGGSVALAKDAEKLGGQLPAYYATKSEVDNAQSTASSAGNIAEANKVALNNGNIMFTVIDGKPMWKERGADTFNPFSSVLESGISAIPASPNTLTTVSLNDTYDIENYSFVIDPIMYYPGEDNKYASNRISAFQYFLNGNQVPIQSMTNFNSIKVSFSNSEGYFRWYVIRK